MFLDIKLHLGTSQSVQWLSVHTSKGGVQSLIRELRSHMFRVQPLFKKLKLHLFWTNKNIQSKTWKFSHVLGFSFVSRFQYFIILNLIYILLARNYSSSNFLQCVIPNELICICAATTVTGSQFSYLGEQFYSNNFLCWVKSEGRRRMWWQRMRCLDGITNSRDMSLSKLREIVKDRNSGTVQSVGCKESDMTQWLNNNNSFL